MKLVKNCFPNGSPNLCFELTTGITIRNKVFAHTDWFATFLGGYLTCGIIFQGSDSIGGDRF